jgi:hypothetical protein
MTTSYTPTDFTAPRYAYYSAEADRIYGYSVYRTFNESNKQLRVTSVGSNLDPKASGYMWEDAKFVGMVALDDRIGYYPSDFSKKQDKDMEYELRQSRR